MKTVDHMLIMDVDGVITNLKDKKANPQMLQYLYQELKKGIPLALNTGRSIEWVKNRVINPLIEKVKDKSILHNFLALGEKGGTWAEFDENGNLLESKNDNISVPKDIQKEVRNLINNEYSDSMFFDESKLTMISTEMKDGHSLEDYKEKQRILSSELQTLLTDKHLAEKFKVDPTTIAVDIENKYVGKGFAVKRMIEWVKSRGIKPQMFIAFGDSSSSDISMAEEIHSQGLSVEFVYVGKEHIDASSFPFTIHQTQTKFEKGTLEFLQTL